MMQNEYGHLVTQYSRDGMLNVNYDDGCDYENTLFNQLSRYLRQYERPDIIAAKDDSLLIMEHFAFDGSKELKHKGMKGLSEESYVTNKLSDLYHSTKSFDTLSQFVQYAQSPENYIENFEKHFYTHYQKIPQYIENVTANEQRTFKRISVGFFIENEYPPLWRSREDGGGIALLPYTKQFLDVFEQSSALDFGLFGYTHQGYKLHYIDKDSIVSHRAHEIDMLKVQFDKLIEMEYGAKFSVRVDEV